MTGYLDDNDIPAWARSAAEKAWYADFGVPTPEGRLFDAHGAVTRAQMIVTLNKMGLLPDIPPPIDPPVEPPVDPPVEPPTGDLPSDSQIGQPWHTACTLVEGVTVGAGAHNAAPVYQGAWNGSGTHHANTVFDIPADHDWYGVYHEGGPGSLDYCTVRSQSEQWKAVLIRSSEGHDTHRCLIEGGQDSWYTDTGSNQTIEASVIRAPLFPATGDPHTDACQAEGVNVTITDSILVAPWQNQNACLQGGGTIDGCILIGGAFFCHSPRNVISNSLLVTDSTLYEPNGKQGPWQDGGGNRWVTLAELAAMLDDPAIVQGSDAGGAHWTLQADGTRSYA